jgi:hypothetical protein
MKQLKMTGTTVVIMTTNHNRVKINAIAAISTCLNYLFVLHILIYPKQRLRSSATKCFMFQKKKIDNTGMIYAWYIQLFHNFVVILFNPLKMI